MAQNPTISAFIVCCNEESQIERCLKSLSFCTEIVVVDSGSKDRTLEICRQHGCRIFERPWPGFVEQKRFALEQCTSEWILNLDADEEVSPELREEILTELKGSPTDVDGFLLSRVVFYLGKWWRKGGWYPELRLRLCRRSKTTWGGEDPHEKAMVDGPTARLLGELRHYTYDNMQDQLNTLNRFSTTAAESLYKRGVRGSVLNLLVNPISRFFKFYLFKKGYREGLTGFIVAVLEAYYAFLKYAKLLELDRGWGKRCSP